MYSKRSTRINLSLVLRLLAVLTWFVSRNFEYNEWMCIQILTQSGIFCCLLEKNSNAIKLECEKQAINNQNGIRIKLKILHVTMSINIKMWMLLKKSNIKQWVDFTFKFDSNKNPTCQKEFIKNQISLKRNLSSQSNIHKHERALGKVNEAFGSISEFRREVSDLSPQHKAATDEIKDLVEQVEAQKLEYIGVNNSSYHTFSTNNAV